MPKRPDTAAETIRQIIASMREAGRDTTEAERILRNMAPAHLEYIREYWCEPGYVN